MNRILALATLCLSLAAPARAQTPLVFDLSSHLIAIRTDFSGAEVLLYGATDGEGDVVVIMRGPDLDTTVRRKERIAGVWMNTRQIEIRGAPSFYRVAASRSLADIAAPGLLARYQIGVDNLQVAVGDEASPQEVGEFRAGLFRNRESAGLYSREIGEVAFLGSRLFRTKVMLPANVPAGGYTAEVLLVRGGAVIAAQTTPMFVSKSGVSADVYEFAHRESAVYGIVTVMLAALAGWAAGTILRRV